MGDTIVRCRTAVPGAVLELLVLASGRRSCIGIDLDSGALVRALEPNPRPLLTPFSVVSGRTGALRTDRPEQPELVKFSTELYKHGTISPRRAERFLRPLMHPQGHPLLGFYGPSTPWWEHDSGPSVTVIEIGRTLRAELTSRGLRARFVWNGQNHDLPLEDLHVLSQLDWHDTQPNASLPIANMVGFRPGRLVVAMGRPNRGYCPKIVAGILPPRPAVSM